MEEGLKEEEEEENHHQVEDEGELEVEDGTPIEDEAEDIGQENLTIPMTSECRQTLIIMKTTGAEMEASNLLEEANPTSRTSRSDTINNRGNIEVAVLHNGLPEVIWRTAFSRWASTRNI